MTPKALQPPPVVVVFNPTNYGLPDRGSMNGSVSRHDASENKKKSIQDKKYLQRRQQCEDERGISEIYEKLQTIEELNESTLDGRARRKLYHLKLIALGAKV